MHLLLLFFFISFFKDFRLVATRLVRLRSPGSVTVDTVTTARASSVALNHDSRGTGVRQCHQAYPRLRNMTDELLSLDRQYLCSARLAERIDHLSILPGNRRRRRLARKRPCRSGRSKQGELSPSSSATSRCPIPGSTSLSESRFLTVPDLSQMNVT